MNLTHLRAFYTVAQEGSFTKAAEILCVSQPVMTTHVSALEDMYGVALFHRHGRHISLTDAGLGLLEIAREVFMAEENAEEFLSGHKQLQAGRLRISVGNPYILTPILRRFHAAFPNIEVSILPGNRGNVRDLLMAEHADIAIQSEPDKDAMIAQKEIVKHELLVFASKTSGYLSDASAISLEELRDLPLVSREKESYTRQIFDQLCSNHHLEIKPSITAANRESVFEIVAGGIGFGVVFSGEIPNDDRITSVRLKEMDRQISDHVIYLKRKADMRIIKAFLSCIEP